MHIKFRKLKLIHKIKKAFINTGQQYNFNTIKFNNINPLQNLLARIHKPTLNRHFPTIPQISTNYINDHT